MIYLSIDVHCLYKIPKVQLSIRAEISKDNKESLDEENHIDFSGITIVINGVKQYIPLSGNFPQFDELNRNAGANYDMIINGLLVTSVNEKAVNPTLIIENVKILK